MNLVDIEISVLQMHGNVLCLVCVRVVRYQSYVLHGTGTPTQRRRGNGVSLNPMSHAIVHSKMSSISFSANR